MNSGVIRTKYVCASGLSSYLVARQGLPCLGFSHVAAQLDDGTLIDSRADLKICTDGVPKRGVQHRPDNYDKWLRVAVVEIPVGQGVAAAWELYLRHRIGGAYDQDAIWGFIWGRPLHRKGQYICSELQFSALHHVGIMHDGHRSLIHPWEVSPDLLFGMNCAVGGKVVMKYGF